jgi:uncharacterized membrane protein
MNPNSNLITVEVHLKIACADYRMILGSKRAWIVAIVVAAIQLVGHYFKFHHG